MCKDPGKSSAQKSLTMMTKKWSRRASQICLIEPLALIMVGYLYHCAMPRIMMNFASVPVVLSESSDQQGACMHMIQDSGSP